MKLNKLLIPSISLMIATPAISLVSCGEDVKDTFIFDSDLQDLKYLTNYAGMQERSDFECYRFYYSELHIAVRRSSEKPFSSAGLTTEHISNAHFSEKTIMGDDYSLVNDKTKFYLFFSINENLGKLVIWAELYSKEYRLPTTTTQINWTFTYDLELTYKESSKIIAYQKINNCSLSGTFTYTPEKGISNEIK